MHHNSTRTTSSSMTTLDQGNPAEGGCETNMFLDDLAWLESEDNDDFDMLNLFETSDLSDDVVLLEQISETEILKPSTMTADDSRGTQVPRMVSLDSQMDMQSTISAQQSTPATPYESLKDLVQTKKIHQPPQTKASGSLLPTREPEEHRTKYVVPTRPGRQVASVFQVPSLFMQQQQQQAGPAQTSLPKRSRDIDRESSGASKRRKMVEMHALKGDLAAPQPASSLLHVICSRGARDGMEAAVSRILHGDSGSASRPASVWVTRSVYDATQRKVMKKRVRETFQYPLNLAIKYGAPNAVIEKLVNAAPHVMSIPDGSERECSLHLILKSNPGERDWLIDMMVLRGFPAICEAIDRHHNTPLHIACMHGASLEVVRHLCVMNPGALSKRNFHGCTPLRVAQRNSISSKSCDAVVDYLSRQMGHKKYEQGTA